MREVSVVGVDVGTQSVKAGLFRVDGTLLAQASRQLPVDRGYGGEVSQDPEDFYLATTGTIASCLDKLSTLAHPVDVVGLGVAGQMAGILGIGSHGEAVTPYDSWLDARCNRQQEQLAHSLGSSVTLLTGCPPMVAHAAKMLWWQQERPDVYARVSKFVVASAYVGMRLCGLGAVDAYIDHTHLHFSGLVDARRAEWSEELASGSDLTLGRLPRIVAPTDAVGRLSARAAEDCGLPSGTVISAGMGDTAAGALGAGIVRSGQLLDISGTASVLCVSGGELVADQTGRLLSMRGPVPGQWVSLSYLAGGDLLAWLPEVLGESSLGLLLKEARAAPPDPRLTFVPHLGGRVLPASPHARGGWVGLRLSHSRGNLTRAVLESVAFEYAGYLQRALELSTGLRPEEVRVIGGGSDNEFWNGIKAAALGLPYLRLDRDDCGCWGAALSAAAAAGAIDDMVPTAAEASAGVARLRPDHRLQDLYAESIANYREVTELLARVTDRDGL